MVMSKGRKRNKHTEMVLGQVVANGARLLMGSLRVLSGIHLKGDGYVKKGRRTKAGLRKGGKGVRVEESSEAE